MDRKKSNDRGKELTMKDDIESAHIVVRDCRNSILSNREWKASYDHGLFHFTPSRMMNNPTLFSDCTFADVFIDHKTSWGAPIPSTFQAFFADVVRALLPEDHKLILNIVDLYEGYFDPGEVIKDILEPENLKYMFLDKEIGEKKHRTLVFECPLEHLTEITDKAFASSLIDIDGFVMKDPWIDKFQGWVSAGNTDIMFRQLIRDVHLAFAVLGDHNGLFIVTDKLNLQELRNLLLSPALEQEIQQYVSQA